MCSIECTCNWDNQNCIATPTRATKWPLVARVSSKPRPPIIRREWGKSEKPENRGNSRGEVCGSEESDEIPDILRAMLVKYLNCRGENVIIVIFQIIFERVDVFKQWTFLTVSHFSTFRLSYCGFCQSPIDRHSYKQGIGPRRIVSAHEVTRLHTTAHDDSEKFVMRKRWRPFKRDFRELAREDIFSIFESKIY